MRNQKDAPQPRGAREDEAPVVEFSNRKDLERWLQDKPREWSVVIAARAALRVAPMLATALLPGARARKIGRDIVFPTFRAIAAAWIAAKWANHSDEARIAATSFIYAGAAAGADAAAAIWSGASATDRAGHFGATAAADAAAFAAAAAAGTTTTTSDFAAATVDAAADTIGVAIWGAVSRDANELEASVPMNRPADHLAAESLWFGTPPGWAAESWNKLKSALLALNEDWEVWTDWYEARLRGSSSNEQLERAHAS